MNKTDQYYNKLKQEIDPSDLEASFKKIAEHNEIKLEDEQEEEIEFYTDAKRKLLISLLLGLCVTVGSFYYVKEIFGFALAWSVVSAVFIAWIYIDQTVLPGDSIKKVAENAVATALVTVGTFAVIVWAVEFGDRWIGGSQTNSIEENTETISPNSSTYSGVTVDVRDGGEPIRVK